MTLKYTTPEAVKAFTQRMEEFSTQEMLEDPNVGAFISGEATIGKNQLGIAEAFLHLFEQREDYEICSKLVRTFPQLQVSP